MFPWLEFLLYVGIVSITPGPNTVMAMNNAKKLGFKGSMGFNLGILCGLFTLMVLCTVFTSLLNSVIERISLPLKIVEALYMGYLIVKTLKPSWKYKINSASFFMGAVLQLMNPKMIVYGLTVKSGKIMPYYSEWHIMLLFAVLLSAAAFAGTLIWSLSGSKLAKLFAAHGTILNVIMALLLLYCAISFFI